MPPEGGAALAARERVRNQFAAVTSNQVATEPQVMAPAGYSITEPLTLTQAVPQGLITDGANTNTLNSVIWTIWCNNLFSGGTIGTAGTVNTNNVTLTTTMPSLTTTELNHVWSLWNAQLQSMTVSNAITTTASVTTANLLTTTQLNTVWTNWANQLHNATPQQVVEAQRRHETYVAQERERQARVQVERTEAEKRAEKLLQDHLSPKQRAELAANRFFTVESIGRDGQRRTYRIYRGRSRNVQQVDDRGRVLKTLCAHPIALVPDPDTMLAQKLMLESSEEEFLRIANQS